MKTTKFIKLMLPMLYVGVFVFGVETETNSEKYQVIITKTTGKIIIDGNPNETAWQNAGLINEFWQHYPVDTIPAYAKTEVKLLYDEEYIYIAARCFEKNHRNIIQTLRRDDAGKFWSSDAFSVIIDPMNGDKNGYFFGLNSAGVQADAAVTQNGIMPSSDFNWTKLWHGESLQTDEGVYYEIAIPFNIVNYNPDNRQWGINFIRNDMKRNVYDLWTRFSSANDGFDFGFNGILEFDGALPVNKQSKLELLPTVSGKIVQDGERGNDIDFKSKAGLDAKLAVGTNLIADLSILPDFSTVEVDQQYINYFRHEWYMPEQRDFFLENNDLLSSFGSYEDNLTPSIANRIKPLYTRRIGIRNWETVPMIYGGRLSGNVSNNLRIGILNVQTGEVEDFSAQNYSVASFQYSVLKRSSVRGLFNNRQAINSTELVNEDFNRNAGVEFDYLSEDGRWLWLAKYHRSINPVNYSNSNFYGGGFAYNSKQLRLQNWVNHVDDHYIADMGYVPRLNHHDDLRDTTIRIGFTEFTNFTEYLIYPATEKISVHAIHIRSSAYIQANGNINEIQHEGGYYLEFGNKASVYTGYNIEFLDLLYPFDVLNNDSPLMPDTYTNMQGLVQLSSDPKKSLSLKMYADYGTFYDGIKTYVETQIGFRSQPWGNFQLSHSYCKLDFDEEQGSGLYNLVGGRSEIYFSKNLTWTTLLQCNTQNNSALVNSMFQWRFRALSDFYIVLKENFSADNLEHENFQVIFKLNYWLKI